MAELGAMRSVALAICSLQGEPCPTCYARARRAVREYQRVTATPPAQETPAYDLARRAHRGQVDKAGASYLGHLSRVVEGLCSLLDSLPAAGSVSPKDMVAAAWLHDIVEDTPATPDDLLIHGFSDAVIAMVSILTKPPGDARSYAERIEGIIASGNLGAILIKIADTGDNGDPRRVALLPPEKRGIADRYQAANARLREAAAGLGWRDPHPEERGAA